MLFSAVGVGEAMQRLKASISRAACAPSLTGVTSQWQDSAEEAFWVAKNMALAGTALDKEIDPIQN